MQDSVAVEALRRHRADTSERKKLAVLQAIEDMVDEGSHLTVAAVSRAAGVSREFIHNHAHLHLAVKQAARRAADREATTVFPTEIHVLQGLRADRATLLAHIERQKRTITEQKEQLEEYGQLRRRWLGAQLPSGERIDPEVHAELRVTNDRLMSDNSSMMRRIAEIGRQNVRLEELLAASRQGHAEALANRDDARGTVVSIDVRKSRN
jgi:hypothetical protein